MGGGTTLEPTLKLAFAGLPSAGKSTLINSLVGARLLETGVCRTTSEPCVISAEHALSLLVPYACEWKRAERLESDDGVRLCIVDLPGVADAENTGNESNFTDLTLKWAAICDVVVWVTDVRTCFLTTHEKLEYERLKATLQALANREGRLFQFCIVMTKCDVDVGVGANGAAQAKQRTLYPGEITSEHEDTTVHDCLVRARRLFPDDHLVPFNAFGRILARADSSDTLRALAMRLAPGSAKLNIDFSMMWALHDLDAKRQTQLLRSTLWHLESSSVELGEMHLALESDACAALVCHLLGVRPRAVTWYHGIREAAFIGVDVASTFVVPPSLAALGRLPRGAEVAERYEYEFLERFYGLSDASKAGLVRSMLALCGPSCLVGTRMYLSLPYNNYTTKGTIIDGNFVHTPPGLPLIPRLMLDVPQGYPSLLELDVHVNANRALSARKSWVAKVRAARVLLWGERDEADVCVQTAIDLADRGILCSVLAPIVGEGTLHARHRNVHVAPRAACGPPSGGPHARQSA